MRRIAVLGAGGFVGARMVEIATLAPAALDGVELVPVIRQPRGLGRNSRLGLRHHRYADAGAVDSLAAVFAGCDSVVNLTLGSNDRILPDLQNIHAACRKAGVPRLIHVSSAEVFGRCDAAGLTDDSPWFREHWMDYAQAKGRAEDWLRGRPDGPEVVTLRPGLIWGPRSSWVAGPAGDLCEGTAWLIDGGKWACNLCHVDNLVHSVVAVARAEGAVAGFYNVGDPDRPSWREYLHGLAREIGVSPDTIAHRVEGDFREGWGGKLLGLKDSGPARAIKRRMSNALKEDLKFRLRRMRRRLRPGAAAQLPGPVLSKGMWWLQTTRYHLPTAKFDARFAPAHRLGFAEGLAGTGAWLRFSGYGGEGR